ncbi:MAG: hypothetical protein WC935_06495 [Thermoleophilia bacterium]
MKSVEEPKVGENSYSGKSARKPYSEPRLELLGTIKELTRQFDVSLP